MTNTKKELAVAALENGTVIDHIPSDVLFQVAEILQISKIESGITIGNNLDSKRMGKKGIIKVADVFFPQETLNRIAVIAPNAKINVIRNYEIVSKSHVELGDEICDIVKCNNPKCITNNEPMMT
ncbi:MAG: aspartate carbamoyltransferase regulatory subunit, partial [Muribaculaceae bacterium]|nr:aspartate carbamoyltransferase regulatory subunit [Muribaculaceae bacterium]